MKTTSSTKLRRSTKQSIGLQVTNELIHMARLQCNDMLWQCSTLAQMEIRGAEPFYQMRTNVHGTVYLATKMALSLGWSLIGLGWMVQYQRKWEAYQTLNALFSLEIALHPPFHHHWDH